MPARSASSVQAVGKQSVSRSENQSSGRKLPTTLRTSGKTALMAKNSIDPPKIPLADYSKQSIRSAVLRSESRSPAGASQLNDKKTLVEQYGRPPSQTGKTREVETRPAATQAEKTTSWSCVSRDAHRPADRTEPSATFFQPRSGYVGLQNLGNTCFMNSILQCVAHAPKFIDRLLAAVQSDMNPDSKLRGQLGKRFAKLMEAMRTSSGVVSPDEVKQMVGKWAPQFSGYYQQDAHEFLRFLLDGLHEDFNRVRTKQPYRELKCSDNLPSVASEWFTYHKKRDDSVVTDFFRGQLLTVITCSCCGKKSAACDTFLDLSIPIANGGNVTLEGCLAKFIEETEVDDYKCEHCKATSRSAMEMTIWKLPPILVIHLKRFSNSSWRRQKIDTPVSFPTTHLDMLPFTPHSSDPSLRYPKYSLFGVSHHMGSLGFGHYVA